MGGVIADIDTPPPPTDQRAGTHVVLTGATGHVGSAAFAELLVRPDTEITCLVRGDDPEAARQRVITALATWLDAAALERAARRVRTVSADITRGGLGLTPSDRAHLVERATHIVHCAASIRFDETLEEARAVNVLGVQRVIELATAAFERGRLRRLTLVSTAFVSGNMGRPFSEHELDSGQGFRTTYERSKFEAELLARHAMRRLPINVVRPSIVVGHSATGRTAAFSVLHAPLRLLLRTGSGVTVPVRADLPLDIVPVDTVARVIVEAMAGGEDGATYAAAAGTDALTMQDVTEVTSEAFGVAPPNLLPAGVSDFVVAQSMGAWQRTLPARARSVLGVYEPYLLAGSEFDNWRGNHLMWRAGRRIPDPRTVLRRSLDHAHATDFGRRLRTLAGRSAVA